MADVLTLNLNAKIDWVLRETLDLSTVTDTAAATYTAAVADGTGADQCDKIWHDSIALATGLSTTLDLSGGLTTTIFGTAVAFTFVKVKAVLIVNTSTTAGDELVWNGTIANSWLGPFNGSATSKIEIGPDSALFVSSKKDGWAVTAGTGDIITITNAAGGTITYKIVIAGTSA